jgi:hypothetical protein
LFPGSGCSTVCRYSLATYELNNDHDP